MLRVSATLSLCLFSSLACAVSYEPLRLGAFELIPDFNTKLTPTGSVLLPNGEEENAELLQFRPRLTAVVGGEGKQFSSSLEVQNGVQSAAGTASYMDWKLENLARVELDGQRSLRLRSEHFNTHEGADNVALAAKPDAARFLTSSFDLDYEQALWHRRGQLVLGAGSFAKDYLDPNAAQDQQDRHVGGSFRLRVLPGAEMNLQYRAREISRLSTTAQGEVSERREVFSYVGGSWEPAFAGAGKLRLSSGYKHTDNGAREQLADLSAWETNLRWQPQADATLSVAVDRSFRERSGMLGEDSTSSYRYNWEQRWASQLKTTLAASYSRNVNGNTRKHSQGQGLKFRLDYAYSTWVDMFVAFGHERRETAGLLTFSQQNLMLGVSASLNRFLGR